MTKTIHRLPHRDAQLRVHLYPERDCVRIAPVGELDIATVGKLEETLHELHEAGFARIVVDLRDLEFLGSAGLRLLVMEHDLARRGGHEFALIAGPPPVQRVLELCGLRDQLNFVLERAPRRSLRNRRSRA